MSVGLKAICLRVASWCAIIAFGIVLPEQKRLGATFFSLWVIFGMWSMMLKCPRCGHSVASRPVKWLHDLPMYDRGFIFIFHRRCSWCRCDLRGATAEAHRRPSRRRGVSQAGKRQASLKACTTYGEREASSEQQAASSKQQAASSEQLAASVTQSQIQARP